MREGQGRCHPIPTSSPLRKEPSHDGTRRDDDRRDHGRLAVTDHAQHRRHGVHQHRWRGIQRRDRTGLGSATRRAGSAGLVRTPWETWCSARRAPRACTYPARAATRRAQGWSSSSAACRPCSACLTCAPGRPPCNCAPPTSTCRRETPIVHVTGVTAALGPNPRAAVFAAVEQARDRGALVSVDINFRSRLWDAEDARPVMTKLAAGAHVLIASPEELALLAPGPEPIPTRESAAEHVVLEPGDDPLAACLFLR